MPFTELTKQFQSMKRHPELLHTKGGEKLAKQISHRGWLGTISGLTTSAVAMSSAPDTLANAAHLSEKFHAAPEIALVGLATLFLGSALNRARQLGTFQWIAENPAKAKAKAETKAAKRQVKGKAEKGSGYSEKSNDSGVYVDDYSWGPYWIWWYGDWDGGEHHGGHHGGDWDSWGLGRRHGGSNTPDLHHHGTSGGDGHGLEEPIGHAAREAMNNMGAFGAGVVAGENHLANAAAEAAKHIADGVGSIGNNVDLGGLAEGAGNLLGEAAKHVGGAASNVDIGPLTEGLGHLAGEGLKAAGDAASGINWGDMLSGLDLSGVDWGIDWSDMLSGIGN